MELDFNFIATCSRGVSLYKDNQIQKIFDSGVCFGVAKIREQYVVLNRNNFNNTGGGDVNGINSLEFFNKDFQHIGSVQLEFIKDGHQIFAEPNGDLLICNTGLDLITQISQEGQISNFAPDSDHGKDIHHYNSIYFKNDTYYICRHRSEFGKDDGGILIYDKNWQFIHEVKVGKHCHDIIEKDGFIYSTSSLAGKLVRIEKNNLENKVEYDIDNKMLTRGLIITDKYLLCGLSQHNIREKRHDAHTAYINVYKYPEMEFIDKIELKEVGQLNMMLLT